MQCNFINFIYDESLFQSYSVIVINPLRSLIMLKTTKYLFLDLSVYASLRELVNLQHIHTYIHTYMHFDGSTEHSAPIACFVPRRQKDPWRHTSLQSIPLVIMGQCISFIASRWEKRGHIRAREFRVLDQCWGRKREWKKGIKERWEM